MAIDADALEDYTGGRVQADDQSARVIARALAAARRHCGWHVSPVLTQTITLDGPGGPVLQLPSLCVTALTAITEIGEAVTIADLDWSRLGLVRKQNGLLWTSRLGGITVTMSHGFDDTAAADFEDAVLSIADRMSQSGGEPISVGPFRWSEDRSAGSGFNAAELATLEQYRLERAA